MAIAGDGISNGPALANADLGMAMAKGSDIALRSADMVHFRDDLRVIADAILLAKGNPHHHPGAHRVGRRLQHRRPCRSPPSAC